MKTVCGTKAYSAPEVNFGGGKAGRYNHKVDTWSLGVILYVIIAAYHPFDPYGDSSDEVIWSRITSCEWDFDDLVWNDISEECKSLISHLLEKNPARRYGCTELLRHPWIIQRATIPDTPLKMLRSSSLMLDKNGKVDGGRSGGGGVETTRITPRTIQTRLLIVHLWR